MRLLRLHIEGSPLYVEQGLNLDFFAADRVQGDHGEEKPLDVTKVGDEGSVYSQNVIGITGVNASGKTTTLNLLRAVIEYMSGSYAMRQTYFTGANRFGKIGNDLTVTVVFWESGAYYLLESELTHGYEPRGDSPRGKVTSEVLGFKDETLWKLTAPRPSRRMLRCTDEFKEHADVVLKRNADAHDPAALPEGAKTFLDGRVSIVSLITGKAGVVLEESERFLHEITMPTEVIQAFDPSIEYLIWDDASQVFRLKFRGETERIVSREVAAQMLSSGTVAGSEMVSHAIDILQTGGYLIVDEIETSLNRSLVGVIIGLFLSPVTNPHGAQLVFSTHYPELLDLLHRKDSIYVLVRDGKFKTEAVKYSDRVDRIENKKSGVIISNLITGSMPSYPDVRAMREYVKERVDGR